MGPQGSAGTGLSDTHASLISWFFRMNKYKAKTLWVISIGSGLAFLLSPLIATPVGTLVDNILLTRFAEQWTQSHDLQLVFDSMALGENIFTFTTGFIALVALVFGVIAARELYKRKRRGEL